MKNTIAIIGGGNLGSAIAEGLIKSKFCKAGDIHITKRNTTTLKKLEAKGVKKSQNYQQLFNGLYAVFFPWSISKLK